MREDAEGFNTGTTLKHTRTHTYTIYRRSLHTPHTYYLYPSLF